MGNTAQDSQKRSALIAAALSATINKIF